MILLFGFYFFGFRFCLLAEFLTTQTMGVAGSDCREKEGKEVVSRKVIQCGGLRI